MNQQLRHKPLPLIDIAAQRRRLGKSIDECGLAPCSAHCQFINGPEVAQLEGPSSRLSAGARHVVTCASGTDALLMVLMARGVGHGDAVLCPSFTFCATRRGGGADRCDGPVFVDVDEATFNMDRQFRSSARHRDRDQARPSSQRP